MATDYYVIVTQLKAKGVTSYELCGHLWATHHNAADIEAGKYREALNHGADLEWLMDDWYVVTAVPYSVARSYRGFDGFKNRRVTSRPTTQQKKTPQQLLK